MGRWVDGFRGARVQARVRCRPHLRFPAFTLLRIYASTRLRRGVEEGSEDSGFGLGVVGRDAVGFDLAGGGIECAFESGEVEQGR